MTRPVDIGVDAARVLARVGRGSVWAIFAHAAYLRVPGGLLALVTTRAPRGPLHIRVAQLPVVTADSPVTVDAGSLRVGADLLLLDAPTWSPGLPAVGSLATASRMARWWLPDLGAALDIGSDRRTGLPTGALDALRRGDLAEVAAIVGGRGPGLTPAGDDLLAGVLFVASASCRGWPSACDVLMQCANQAETNDIARAFLACAARGRCIEPAHELLAGLADADHAAVNQATAELQRFGSSSGVALLHGIRTALLELPGSAASWASVRRNPESRRRQVGGEAQNPAIDLLQTRSQRR